MTLRTRTRVGSTVAVANMREASLVANLGTIVAADLAIASAKEQRSKAVEAIASVFGPGKHIVEGYGEVTISPNNTYDSDVILAALTPGQFTQRASKRVLDKDKVKNFYPAVYAASQRQNGWVGKGARLY